MKSLIEQAYDPSVFRKRGHELIDLLADYLANAQHGNDSPVFKSFEPDALFKQWKDKLDHREERDFKSWAGGVLNDSIHLHNPGYMGHQVSPVLPEAALADLLGALMNNGMGVYEMGSPTVAMERAVIKQLAETLGFKDGADGILTSGGTLGNLTALLAARQIKGEGDTWKKGNGRNQYAFMVSDQAHYSIDRAVRIMGWGEQGIVKVPTDERYRLDPAKLQETFGQAKEKGVQVLGVVGSACSTATGSFDPLPEIARFCARHDLWFHVDAAHGGPTAYSEKHRHKVAGIEKADSVVVDFHKMMMCPALVTGVIFKDPAHSYKTFSQEASYLWNQNEPEWFNLGKRTFECTKGMMALKAFALLAGYGPMLFEEIVDQLFDLAQTFADLIEDHENFELLVQPECNILCFRHVPNGIQNLNKHNAAIRRAIIDGGHSFLVQAEVNGRLYLRTALMNVFTKKQHLKDLLAEIDALSGIGIA